MCEYFLKLEIYYQLCLSRYHFRINFWGLIITIGSEIWIYNMSLVQWVAFTHRVSHEVFEIKRSENSSQLWWPFIRKLRIQPTIQRKCMKGNQKLPKYYNVLDLKDNWCINTTLNIWKYGCQGCYTSRNSMGNTHTNSFHSFEFSRSTIRCIWLIVHCPDTVQCKTKCFG